MDVLLQALTTLALGVGVTVTIFTVVNGVLPRPIPRRAPGRVRRPG